MNNTKRALKLSFSISIILLVLYLFGVETIYSWLSGVLIFLNISTFAYVLTTTILSFIILFLIFFITFLIANKIEKPDQN